MPSGRRQSNQPEHIYIHGTGDWEQEALRRQRNIMFAIRVVTTSFQVTGYFIQSIINRFKPATEILALGREIDERGQESEVIGLPVELLDRHLHVLGGTGRGKTTLLVNAVIQLMLMGRSIVLVDPKGDLVDSILRFVPPDRIQDVILFDPCDTKYPVAWNVFNLVNAEDRSRLAGEILLVIRKLVGDSWGPRLDSLLRLATLALLEFPGATFLDLYYFFTDEAFRHTVLSKVTDTFVKEFWDKTFATWSPSQQANAINPVLNKLEPFLSHEIARHILGQSGSSFTLRDVMDSGKILLVRIPQGILGEDLSKVIGGLFTAKLHMDIISRQDTPISQRRKTVVIVDEFQEISSDNFAQTLSLARSYQVACILANQYMGQLPTLLAQSLDYNCAVRLTGHLEGSKHLIEFDLLQDIDQPKFFIRPLLPAHGPSEETAESIRTMSQLRYGTELQDVQRQLRLRNLRRTQYAAVFMAEQRQKEEAQKYANKPQKAKQQPPAQKPAPSVPPSTNSQSEQQPTRQAGAKKPTVLKHASKPTKPTKKTQKGTKGKRPKDGGNAP